MITQSLKILTTTTLITLLTNVSGCTILNINDKDEILKDYQGNWQITTITGNQEEQNLTDQNIKLQLDLSDKRLIGTVIPDYSYGTTFGIIHLDINRVEKNQLTGNFWLFGIADQGISIPLIVELNEEKDQLTSILKMSEVDQSFFPEEIRENLEDEKIFDDNWTIIATNKDVSSNLEPFENQATKAKQSEAKQNISTINKGQQVYYLENDRFTDNLDQLQVGLKSETVNYSYHINLMGQNVHHFAIAKQENLKTYTGGVFQIKDQNGDNTTIATVCESDQATQDQPPSPILQENELICPDGFTALK